MSKYLTKLKEGTNPSWGKSQLFAKFNFTGMNCANSFKEGLSHKFESNDATDVTLLIDIIKRFRLDVKITEITSNSFVFSSPNERIQIFFFRICRYVRRANIKKILTDTVLINKAGVKIQNAFLIAHYYNYNSQGRTEYYNYGMDGFWDPASTNPQDVKYNKSLNKPYKLLKDLKKVFYLPNFSSYNTSLYQYDLNKAPERKTFISLVKSADFKAAEKYLLFVFK